MKQFKFFRGNIMSFSERNDYLGPIRGWVNPTNQNYQNLLNRRYQFHNNIMVSNNFKLFIDSRGLEQLRTIVRETLSQHQIQYVDWRIDYLTLIPNEETTNWF